MRRRTRWSRRRSTRRARGATAWPRDSVSLLKHRNPTLTAKMRDAQKFERKSAELVHGHRIERDDVHTMAVAEESACEKAPDLRAH